MARKVDQLTPFVSLTLMSAPKGQAPDVGAADVQAIVAGLVADVDGVIEPLAPRLKTKVAVRGFTYSRRVQPAWTDETIYDLQNHLVLVISAHGHVGIHATDPKLQDKIKGALLSSRSTRELAAYAPIPRERLEQAFIAEGPAKTLWLSGIHAKTALKANAKILSGEDLTYALDVLDDQSFWWSAARSKHPRLPHVVGASARTSRVWVRKAGQLEEFETLSIGLLKHLAKDKGKETLRVLARPAASADLTKLNQAYDLSLMPPDYGAEVSGQDAIEDLVKDADDARFEVTGRPTSPNFDLEIFVRGTSVHKTAVLVVDGRSAGQVALKLEAPGPTGTPAIVDPQLDRIVRTLRRGAAVNVRFDSGHAISGGRVFPTVYRRIAFDRFVGKDFPNTEIKKEKPIDMARIGSEDSLFCWLQRQTDGFLMCDDGAMEKADFIHIDDSADPTLTFYHIKGSHSALATRQISVSAYEVVAAQAIKNLIWLDRASLLTGLKARVRDGTHFWRDRKPSDAKEFQKAVNSLKGDFKRRVVIVQPSLSLKKRKAYQGKRNANDLRLDQLDVLLATADASCKSLSAKFDVYCAK